MDFVAIDFETANANRSSACAIGIVEVQAGEILSEQAWLIDPGQTFERMNISIHGITPAMVQGQPSFHELWPTLEPLLSGRHIVAHNASFDMSVLRYCLDRSDIPYPSFQYYCTYQLSKKILPDMPSYKLNRIAEHLGIPLQHHDALEDARAAAVILMKWLEQYEHADPLQLAMHHGYRAGTLFAGGYTPFTAPPKASRKRNSAVAYVKTKN